MIGEGTYSRYINQATPEEKINYSYSTYHGEKFYVDWELTRGSALSKIFDEQRSKINLDTALDNILSDSAMEGSHFLFHWLGSVKNKKLPEDIFLLVKRFEVTKKIYNSYDENFRPDAKASFDDLSNYVIFGLVLLHAYSKTGLLPFFNSLLKINDIIVSNVEHIKKDSVAQLVEHLLKSEMDIIHEIKENNRR